LKIEFRKENKYHKIIAAWRKEASHPGAQNNFVAEQVESGSYSASHVY